VEDLASRRLVGIITDRDIALHVVAEGRNPRETSVKDVMSDGLVTCLPDDDVEEVLSAMTEHRLRRIPVVDQEGRLRGIIAQADVAIRLNAPARVGEVVAEVSH
jgi:CBS domain-containing protein